jgi:hypothetical protein
VSHEVINEGHDRTQLDTMGKKALEATGQEEITVLAGRGYYKGEEVLALGGDWRPALRAQAANFKQSEPQAL